MNFRGFVFVLFCLQSGLLLGSSLKSQYKLQGKNIANALRLAQDKKNKENLVFGGKRACHQMNDDSSNLKTKELQELFGVVKINK